MQEIRNVAVIGAGTMGSGIAQAFAHAGYTVWMQAPRDASLRKSFDLVRANLDSCLENGLLKEREAQEILSRIRGMTKIEEFAKEADFVIEAAPEKLDLKQQLFAELDKQCRKGVILASNTSGLSISEMASETNRASQVVGAHFWNPPHLIPLVEVVRGKKTSEETVNITVQLMKAIGKKPVLVNMEVPGFVGTRLHQALIREAFYIVEQGIASIEDVDTVVKTSFGRRLAMTGPFETCDLGGLDVFLAAAEVWRDLSNSSEPSPLLKEKVKNGLLGTKSGKGLYDWDSHSISRIKKQREEVLTYHLRRDMTDS